MPDTYHHGDLRAAILDRVGAVIVTQGVDRVSLRALAADLKVSHTAPRHHFGSRQGVLTAFATQGFERLAESLGAIRTQGGGFLDVGVGYVAFALEHRAHFAVMFDLEATDPDDPVLAAAKEIALGQMRAGVDEVDDRQAARTDQGAAALAGWALMHGLAILAIGGNLDLPGVRSLVGGGGILDLARRSGGMLFGPPGPGGSS